MLTALRQASPVVVDVAVDVRYQLMRRYVEVSVRNSQLALMSFAIVMFAIAHQAPLWPRVAAFMLLAAMTLVRTALARGIERRLDPGDPRSDWRHDALVITAMLIWGSMPFAFAGRIAEANLAVVVYATVISIALLSVSYIAALPACAAAFVFTVLPLVAFLLSRGTFLDAMTALATVMFAVALQLRLRASHRTLLEALAAQRDNANLVKELESYRRQLEQENAELGDSLRDASQAANRDPLTGLFNRRYLSSVVRPLAKRVLEEQEAVTIGVVDIDHFKRVNDAHGHLVGDQVLRSVAQLLSVRLRDHDGLVRFGGEEFVVVLRRCDMRRGRRVAEALRHNVASAEIETDAGLVPITVSIGVAQWAPGEDLDEVIQRADRTLYAAKQAGRDRVEVDGGDALNPGYPSGGDSTLPSTMPASLH